MVKEFLSRHRIPFQEVQVFGQPGGLDELMAKTGTMTAPVVLIDEQFVKGYDPGEITRLLMRTGWI